MAVKQGVIYSPQFYFIPKFARIVPPTAGEKDFEAKPNHLLFGPSIKPKKRQVKVLALGLQPVNGCRNSGQRLLFILISQIAVTHVNTTKNTYHKNRKF